MGGNLGRKGNFLAKRCFYDLKIRRSAIDKRRSTESLIESRGNTKKGENRKANLDVVLVGGGLSSATSPVGVEELSAALVGAFIGVSTKVVALSLDERGRTRSATQTVVVSQAR